MKSISKEYLFLFNTISNTERALEQLQRQLMEAQLRAEELFLTEPEEMGESA